VRRDKERNRRRDSRERGRDRNSGLWDPPPGWAETLGSLKVEIDFCRNRPCRRGRECLDDPGSCAMDTDEIIEWLRHAVRAGRAGLSPVAAARAANRHVLARRHAATRSGGNLKKDAAR
jgi:hypothetical protein